MEKKSIQDGHNKFNIIVYIFRSRYNKRLSGNSYPEFCGLAGALY
jgi:hypothetical protein